MSAYLAFVALTFQNATPITINVKPNDRFSYRVSTVLDAGAEGGKVDLVLEFAERVIRTDSKEIVYSCYYSDVKFNGTGPMASLRSNFEDLKGLKMTHHRDRGNETLKVILMDQEFDRNVFGTTSDCTWPIRPLAIGEVWKSKRDVENLPQKADVVNTLVQVTEKLKVPCWEVKSILSVPGSLETLEPIMTWVECSTGRPMFGTGKFKVTVQGASVIGSYTFERTETRIAK